MTLPRSHQVRLSGSRFWEGHGSRAISGVHHPQPQHFLARIKIAVPVQQLIPSKQTERSDPAVDGLADGISSLTQDAIVRRRGNCVFSTARLKYVECEKLIAYLLKL